VTPDTHAKFWLGGHIAFMVLAVLYAIAGIIVYFTCFDTGELPARILSGSLLALPLAGLLLLPHLLFRVLLRPRCPACRGGLSVGGCNPVVYLCQPCGKRFPTRIQILYPGLGDTGPAYPFGDFGDFDGDGD